MPDDMDHKVLKDVLEDEMKGTDMERPMMGRPVDLFLPQATCEPIYGATIDPSDESVWTEEELKLIDEWEALGNKQDEASRARLMEIDRELHQLRFPKPKTFEENKKAQGPALPFQRSLDPPS